MPISVGLSKPNTLIRKSTLQEFPIMSTLKTLLDSFRAASATEREKGTYFEELICTYLRNEAIYHDLYRDVLAYADWAAQQGLDGRWQSCI